LVKEWLKDADMALWKHPSRDCIYEEAVQAKGLFHPSETIRRDIDRQIEHYRQIGIPRHIGMAECGVIIRRNKPIVNRFNEAWWAEICCYSQRDQISFPVVLREFPDLKVNFIKGNSRHHEYFNYEHR
jgi:hypothetical protein